ncbi:uncharacterized protein LOC129574453 [Sitodiplosis mosellana]|uniref:uncharacterized protein LOC129574453 n=1 Tax=Sitodiplosis mosellana TaxID=263140 RepID=UPI002443A9F7|nr:uncharacterized protein LOC129574453 [Sitodiplosis mosellana]
MLNIGSSCGMGGPVYVYFTQGIRTTTIEVKIPFAEEDPSIEYAMNMLLQFVVYFHGFIIYGSMEMAMALFGNVINISPRLIKNRLKELFESRERKEVSELQLRVAFQDITKQLLDYEDFVACLRDFVYWRTLVTPALFTYSIAMAIFCQYTMGFEAGYGMALMSWVQFYFICETGQDIEENGLDEILYDSNWNCLPCELQKDLMQLISQRQNRVTLSFGPFGVVNRDLLKNVCVLKM